MTETGIAALHQVLLLHRWFVLLALIGLLWLIARFYARFSGVRLPQRWLILAAILYGAHAVRGGANPTLAALGLGIGGVIVTCVAMRIGWRMLRPSVSAAPAAESNGAAEESPLPDLMPTRADRRS